MNPIDGPIGNIAWLKCKSCLFEFPVFYFSGETDMATDEFRSSVDVLEKTVFVFYRSDDFPGGKEVFIARIECVNPLPDENFKDFLDRNRNSVPRYIYSCVNCDSDSAEVVKTISEQELRARGYQLIRNFRIKS